MFNLIRRDAILQKWQLLIFVPFILFFVITEVPAFLAFMVASIFIPFNAFAYDEKAKTNILLNSLPYTRKEIIASRYLGAIVYMLLSIGMTSIALSVFNKPFTMTDIAIGGGLFLLFAAFTFPLFQIFKPGHITPIILISFILLTWVARPVISFINKHLTVITDFIADLSNLVLYTGTAVIVIAFYGISWGLATFIYQKKVF
ncbi:ABC-2 transporter permease [Lederbergia galactosidilytica]|uniref:Multidrug ABC transporter permease n=1 Tax=Lederbergia galactosidilytica TaxID=217031 RepID=A0A0Q9Y7A5_9BACI|nr:ABC-2 transporter permease [Lederbergia galactosidilytica]KRG12910.1 multidrug ABC transporter permease [Lederbergia galactosidilytica]OAK70673.1 multidrug ABC transporter permease [Lederbergia galactosidilytica]